MIDYGLFMMIYKPSKLIYSSVHIDRVYHFIIYTGSFYTYTIIYVGHFRRTPEKWKHVVSLREMAPYMAFSSYYAWFAENNIKCKKVH